MSTNGQVRTVVVRPKASVMCPHLPATRDRLPSWYRRRVGHPDCAGSAGLRQELGLSVRRARLVTPAVGSDRLITSDGDYPRKSHRGPWRRLIVHPVRCTPDPPTD